MKLRSLLFVPGNRERFLAKLEALRPDAAILDLEDSIPPSEKATASGSLTLAVAEGNVRAAQAYAPSLLT